MNLRNKTWGEKEMANIKFEVSLLMETEVQILPSDWLQLELHMGVCRLDLALMVFIILRHSVTKREQNQKDCWQSYGHNLFSLYPVHC